MTKVIADITMSLDGYVTGAGADAEHGLGDAEELHTWVFSKDAVETEILEGASSWGADSSTPSTVRSAGTRTWAMAPTSPQRRRSSS
jgi:hypothetical protein